MIKCVINHVMNHIEKPVTIFMCVPFSIPSSVNVAPAVVLNMPQGSEFI